MFRVFTRRWWKGNPNYPNGLEPYAGGRKTTIKKGIRTADGEISYED